MPKLDEARMLGIVQEKCRALAMYAKSKGLIGRGNEEEEKEEEGLLEMLKSSKFFKCFGHPRAKWILAEIKDQDPDFAKGTICVAVDWHGTVDSNGVQKILDDWREMYRLHGRQSGLRTLAEESYWAALGYGVTVEDALKCLACRILGGYAGKEILTFEMASLAWDMARMSGGLADWEAGTEEVGKNA